MPLGNKPYSETISQHQAITYVNVVSNLCHHKASLGHNELNIELDKHLICKIYVHRFKNKLYLMNLNLNIEMDTN